MFSRNLTGISCACAMRSPFTGPGGARRQLRHRADRIVRFRRDTHALDCAVAYSIEAVDEDPDRADLAEAETGEDRPRHRPRLRDEHRRPAGDRVLPARRHQRPVSAAAARFGQRRAAEERHAVAPRTTPRHAPPARRRRRRDTSTLRSSGSSGGSSVRRRRHRLAEPDRGDPLGFEALFGRARPAHLDAVGRGARRAVPSSTIPIASGSGASSTRPSACSRSTRSPGVALEPTSQLQRRPAALAQELVDLGAHLGQLVGAQAEPLRDIPAGLVAPAHPEHVSVGDDALVRGAERRVGVRVLGELEDPVVGRRSVRAAFPRHGDRCSSGARRA